MFLNNLLINFEKYKDNIFYSKSDITLTYTDLKERVKKLYDYLLTLKKEKDNRVVVFGHKNVNMIVSFIACSFAGITYVPVDSNVNTKRLNEIIDIVNPIAIINAEENTIVNNNLELKLDKLQDTNRDLIPLMNEEDVYYIIFTSGSTGVPKGVQVTYSNLNSFIDSIVKDIDVSESVILNQALYSFDLSVADIYLSLSTGSEHVPIEDVSVSNYNKMMDYIYSKDVEVIVCTSTFLDYLLLDRNFIKDNVSNLKYIYLCGEILKNKTLSKAINRLDYVKIVNAYGPTECTVAITNVVIDKKINEEIPIGKIEDDNFVIVDENIEQVEDGVCGEILIYGKFVSNGYINKTEKRKNFIEYKNNRAYRTGDIGYIKDGYLYFKCRKDRQIKYKGYRIELDDIENNISTLSCVNKCVVVAKKNEDKVTNLIAYITLNKECENIKEEISKLLPEYMMPDIKIFEDIPVNNNFKIDKKKIEEKENERENN